MHADKETNVKCSNDQKYAIDSGVAKMTDWVYLDQQTGD